jgi:hypothetical protein
MWPSSFLLETRIALPKLGQTWLEAHLFRIEQAGAAFRCFLRFVDLSLEAKLALADAVEAQLLTKRRTPLAG